MTNPKASAVTRYDMSSWLDGEIISERSSNGVWVKFTDYEKLQERVKELEILMRRALDISRRHPDFCLHAMEPFEKALTSQSEAE